jgi:heme-degrading monooxygenase HmoA
LLAAAAPLDVPLDRGDGGHRGGGMSHPAGIAATLEPPYFAVIFTSILSDDTEGYDDMAARMAELARSQPGFLGLETVREGRLGITVSYWTTEDAVLRWKRQVEHRAAQRAGRDRWYARYKVRIAKVERDYGREQGHT